MERRKNVEMGREMTVKSIMRLKTEELNNESRNMEEQEAWVTICCGSISEKAR